MAMDGTDTEKSDVHRDSDHQKAYETVSYTHLTLPTIYYV